MMQQHKLAIVGFTPAEALALMTYFRLTLGTAQGYALVAQPRMADLVLADGANTAVLNELRGMRLTCHMLLLGASDEYPNLPFEPRPLDKDRIRKAIDYLLGRHELPQAQELDNAGPGWAATQPFGAVSKGKAAGRPAYAATEPMGLEAVRTPAGYAATQPMGLMPEAGSAPARAPMQPAWEEEDEITEDEVEAFRKARALANAPVAAPVEAPPVQAPFVSMMDEPPSAPRFALSDAGDSFVGLKEPARTSPAPRADQPQVLLVDEKDFDGVRFERVLRPMGYGLVRVRDEREAFEAIATCDFHFIFIDTQAANGYGTARALRQRTKAAGAPPTLVALSRVGGTLERIRARLAGCDLTMAKPVQPEEFARHAQQRQSLLAAKGRPA